MCDENPRRVTEETGVGADHLVEDVRGDVAVDGRQRVVEQVQLLLLIHCSGETDTGLLPSGQIDALQPVGRLPSLKEL